ncbi:hypothetical protein K439DRAFT_1416020, partial [Ramaria rubella]
MLPGASLVNNASDDVDEVWGETNDIPAQEWSKMDNDFTNAGYREGITAGKEAALQEGFDEGFAQIGAPLGRRLGGLRGAANAALSFMSLLSGEHADAELVERRKNELRDIIGNLERIHLADLAPRDLQAEEHAREHIENISGDVTAYVAVEAGTNKDRENSSQPTEYLLKASNTEEQSSSRPAVQELDQIRARLYIVLKDVGLNISLD